MEEKHVPDQEKPAFLEGGIPEIEPEAAEIPLFEALTFTPEDTQSDSGEAASPEGEPAESAEIAEAEILAPNPEPEAEASPTDLREEAAAQEEPQVQEAALLPTRVEDNPAEMPATEPAPPPAEAPSENSASSREEEPAAPVPSEPFGDDLPEPSGDGIPADSGEIPAAEDISSGDLPEETEAPAPDLSFRDEGEEFEEMLHAPAPEAAENAPPKPHEPKKGRPKRKKGEGLLGIPNILATVVWLGLILAIGITAGRMLWVCAADVLAFGREDRPVTVTVYESDDLDTIVEKLYSNGLIRYRSLFRLYAGISHAEDDIDPGIYDLNAKYDYHALVKMMSASSTRTVVKGVLIPEGFTCRQIFNLLEDKRICTAQDLAAYAASGELKDYWFLDGVDRGTNYCLEGYLFPDTYDFYKNSTPREVLEKMLDNFDTRFDEQMRSQIDTLNSTVVTGGGYTVREVTIIASMIEKEAAAPAEAPTIAGVIYNRLFRWGNNPAYLNIDASIVYALDGKNELTREDLQIDSPYNTYTNIGLTPTPISNPGLSSLKAALSPASHNYYYYVLNPQTGMHTFSSTYEEHSGYVAAYAEGQ